MSRPLRTLSVFLLLLGGCVALRLPFLGATLVGEEGSFAYLIAGPIASGRLTHDGLPQMMVGMLGDAPALYPFQRTIMPYILLEYGPGTLLRALNITLLPETARTATVRSAYFALYLIGVAGMLWRAAREGADSNCLPVAVATFATCAPLAVAGSVQPQIDGSIGVLLLGVAALLLVPNGEMRGIAWRGLLAGFIVGLGRHEWGLALLGGTLGALLLAALLLRDAAERQAAWSALLPVPLGLLIAASLSFGLSPSEFLSGFDVQRRVTGHASWMALLRRDVLHASAAMLLLSLVGLLLLARLRATLAEAPGIAVITGAGLILFAGAAATGWPGDGFARYYAPVLVLAGTAGVALTGAQRSGLACAAKMPVVGLLLLAILAGLVPLHAAWRNGLSITSGAGVELGHVRAGYSAVAAEWASDPAYAPLRLAPAGLWLYHPLTSFLGTDMGLEFGGTYLAEQHPDWAPRLRAPGR
jgi:hypothetical protein